MNSVPYYAICPTISGIFDDACVHHPGHGDGLDRQSLPGPVKDRFAPDMSNGVVDEVAS